MGNFSVCQLEQRKPREAVCMHTGMLPRTTSNHVLT